MKKIFLACTLWLFAGQMCFGQSSTDSSGLVPYTPTRLEWLVLELNALFRHETPFGGEKSGYTVTFVAKGHDTILLLLQHEAAADRRSINITMQSLRNAAKITAKGHGWDGWLNIKEEIYQVGN